MSAKEALKSIYDSIADDCTFEEVESRLQVLKAIEEGLKSLETEPVYNHNEAWEKLREWRQERN